MKFSIITCTWNSEKYIGDTIDSVLRQQYSDYEMIFVDGGSTDRTLEIIDSINIDKKILYNENRGISNAMNAGANAANGEIIVHLHSDDYFADCKVLNKVSQAFCENDIKWLFGRCKRLIEQHEKLNNHETPRFSKRQLIKRNFIPHPATFIRKDFFHSMGGFDPTLKYAMDYDLWLRASKEIPLQLNEYLSVFREHSGSLSTANRFKAFLEDHTVRRRHISDNIVLQIEMQIRFLIRSIRIKI